MSTNHESTDDTIAQWEAERIARKEDEARASAAGLGVDPAFIAQRERVARVEWIEVEG